RTRITKEELLQRGEAQSCSPSGTISGKEPPPGQCNRENDSDCCKQGEIYTTYTCSPPVSSNTAATLTLNSFEKSGDGGAESECDGDYHSNDTPVVALSTDRFNNRSRCLKYIRINGNGKSEIPRLLISVIQQWDVTKFMTINLLAITT
ncbi:hypothetical protein RJ641_016046, partial [Dillenia turbinata]